MNEKQLDKLTTLEGRIASEINKLSLEHDFGDTPDFILGRIAVAALVVFGDGEKARQKWYTKEP